MADAEGRAVEALSSQDQKGKEQAAGPGSARPKAGPPCCSGERGCSWPGGVPRPTRPWLGLVATGGGRVQLSSVAARPGLRVEWKEQSQLEGAGQGPRPGIWGWRAGRQKSSVCALFLAVILRGYFHLFEPLFSHLQNGHSGPSLTSSSHANS